MTKKILSFVLAMTLVVSLFAGLTVTASADYAGGTFTKAAGTLESGYYVFGTVNGETLKTVSNDTSRNKWLAPGDGFLPDGPIENPDSAVVWYYDSDTGTLNSAGNPALFVSWKSSEGNSARASDTATAVSIVEASEGLYHMTVKDVPSRTLCYNVSSDGWRFYTSSNSNQVPGLVFFKLSDGGETPAHEHDWSAWSSNNDGTHSRTCQGEDCPIGSQTENCSFESTVTKEASCAEEGELEKVCEVCGYTLTEAIPATGEHSDEDGDGLCDVCGAEMPEIIVYTRATELHEGDEVVIRTCAVAEADGGYVVLSTTADGKKLSGVQANVSIEEEALEVVDKATAVMTVEYADAKNFRLKNVDGTYLSTGSTGSSLSFAAAADDYSLWYLEAADANSVYIKSTNAKYNGRVQALEYYNGLFTTYGEGTADAYKFMLYVHANESAHVHEWTSAVTREASCTEEGVLTYTCSGCDESYTEPIPMIPHADADGDGLCDACQGAIYSAALAVNDKDTVVIVYDATGDAMTDTASGKGMASLAVNAQAGVTVPAAGSIWTVKTAEGGFYLLNAQGQYLTSGETGNSMSLEAEANDYSLWTLETADEEQKLVYVRNVNAAYNGSQNQALEFYQGTFTTYGLSDKNKAQFLMALYTLPGEEESKPEVSADVYGVSVSLKGNIGLNFFLIPSEELLADANASVQMEIDREEGTETLSFPIAGAATRVVGEDTLYQFSVSLNAKQMNDEVTLRVLDGEGKSVAMFRRSNQQDITDSGLVYSVQDYILATMDSGADQKLKALAAAMSDFGSLAQAQFAYKTEDRAQIRGDLDSVTAQTLAEFEAEKTIGTATGVSYYASSLLLQSETTLRFYFTLEEGEIGDYTFKLGSKEVTPVQNGEYWTIDVPNVTAKNLSKSYTVNVSSAEGNVLTVKASGLSYAYSALSGGSNEQTLIDLAKGLYLYNRAAIAYFG